MEVSAEMRKPAGAAWISAMEESNLLLGAVLGVIHPPTYKAGIQCIRQIAQQKDIAKRENLEELLRVWTSPCVAGSVMNNRNSPIHRDTGGSHCSMDLLASVGKFSEATFAVPSLGYQFCFRSGAIFGILGKIVPHGATVTGERLCYAQYLRDNIFSTLGVEQPGWMNMKDI